MLHSYRHTWTSVLCGCTLHTGARMLSSKLQFAKSKADLSSGCQTGWDTGKRRCHLSGLNDSRTRMCFLTPLAFSLTISWWVSNYAENTSERHLQYIDDWMHPFLPCCSLSWPAGTWLSWCHMVRDWHGWRDPFQGDMNYRVSSWNGLDVAWINSLTWQCFCWPGFGQIETMQKRQMDCTACIFGLVWFPGNTKHLMTVQLVADHLPIVFFDLFQARGD